MKSSVFFYANEKIIIEYIYNDKTINSSLLDYKKIVNSNDNSITISHSNEDSLKINNIVKRTVVKSTDLYNYLMGKDTAYYYPLIDSNVVLSDITFSTNYDITFDTIKIHVISGYNFNDVDGFIFNLQIKDYLNNPINLLKASVVKSDTEFVYFNPRPLVLSDRVYDKYYQFNVPSCSFILNQQNLNPGDDNNLGDLISTNKIKKNGTIDFYYSEISKTNSKNGLLYYEEANQSSFTFNNEDIFDQLVASIEVNEEDGYFNFTAKWENESIENFIYDINSIAGNSYYLIHKLRIYAQDGVTFKEVDNYTRIQQDEYTKVFKYKPVIEDVNIYDSLSVDYQVVLYNSFDGLSITKEGSISTTNLQSFGPNNKILNIGNTTKPFKIYNKVVETNIALETKQIDNGITKIVYQYINSLDLTTNNREIKIRPFTEIFTFKINNKSGKQIVFDQLSNYYLIFLSTDGSKIYVSEILDDINRKKEEISFKITEDKSKLILQSQNKNFYIISKFSSTETILVEGNWIS